MQAAWMEDHDNDLPRLRERAHPSSRASRAHRERPRLPVRAALCVARDPPRCSRRIGATKGTGFVEFIVALTSAFYAPFKGIVANDSLDRSHPIVWPIVIAIVAYMLLHAAVRALLRLMKEVSRVAVAAWSVSCKLATRWERDAEEVTYATMFGFEQGTVIGGSYRVVGALGRGGMGVVLRARDERLERDVAIKLIRPELLNEELRERFLHEARAMARVSHPNVLPIYAFGEHRGGAILRHPARPREDGR